MRILDHTLPWLRRIALAGVAFACAMHGAVAQTVVRPVDASRDTTVHDFTSMAAMDTVGAVPDVEGVAVQPKFPGGSAGLSRYLSGHLVYPPKPLRKGVQGTVYVQFVIDDEGRVGRVFVQRGVHPDLDAEAVRVVRAMPNWEPGTLNGDPVKVRFMQPIVFRIAGP